MATGDPSEHLRQVGFIYQPAVSTAGFLNQALSNREGPE